MQATSLNWQIAPERVALRENEVHIWRTSLQRAPEERARFQRFLTSDEMERARSFCSQEKRTRWIVARGTLRILLGAYLDTHPARLRFRYEEHGKPVLAGDWQRAGLHFNLSHSATLAAYAFTYTRRLGLDIERIRPSFAGTRLARQKFALGEFLALQSLPVEEQARAFFTCWTRKEAYIKAHGEGLAYGLRSFEVSLKPGERAALLANRRDPQECERWSMHDLILGEDYVGTLVVERADTALDEHFYELPGKTEPLAKQKRGEA